MKQAIDIQELRKCYQELGLIADATSALHILQDTKRGIEFCYAPTDLILVASKSWYLYLDGSLLDPFSPTVDAKQELFSRLMLNLEITPRTLSYFCGHYAEEEGKHYFYLADPEEDYASVDVLVLASWNLTDNISDADWDEKLERFVAVDTNCVPTTLAFHGIYSDSAYQTSGTHYLVFQNHPYKNGGETVLMPFWRRHQCWRRQLVARCHEILEQYECEAPEYRQKFVRLTRRLKKTEWQRSYSDEGLYIVHLPTVDSDFFRYDKIGLIGLKEMIATHQQKDDKQA